MLGKYRYHANDIITYIVNRVGAGAGRDQVCAEVQSEFSLHAVLYDMPKEMVYETIGLFWDMAYFMINKQFHKE